MMFASYYRAPQWLWIVRLLLIVFALAVPVSVFAAAPEVQAPPEEPILEPGSSAEVPGPVYLVQPGDNLTRLAEQLGTSVESLVSANHITDPNTLQVGARLIVPHHLPVVDLALLNPRRGLAMAVAAPQDLAALGVGWYYVWDWCNRPRCVPMAYFMDLPPACPPLLLVGNEPNAVRPFGGPLTPAEAATKVLAIEKACPRTRLVAGNVAADDWRPSGGWGSGHGWLAEFLRQYQAAAGHRFNQTLGVHCYAQAVADYCLEQLADLRGLFVGPMWVTEFGILSGAAQQYATLLNFIDAHFERYAAYTNRQPHTGQGWELNMGVELVLPDGRLAPAGEIYADWPGRPRSQVR
jgi:LysM repeat protein